MENLFKQKKSNRKNQERKQLKTHKLEKFDYFETKYHYIFNPKKNIFFCNAINEYYKFDCNWYEKTPLLFVEKILVFEEFRNKGYGSIMLKHILQFAKNHACNFVYIKCAKNTYLEDWLMNKGFCFQKDIKTKNSLHKWQWLSIKI